MDNYVYRYTWCNHCLSWLTWYNHFHSAIKNKGNKHSESCWCESGIAYKTTYKVVCAGDRHRSFIGCAGCCLGWQQHAAGKLLSHTVYSGIVCSGYRRICFALTFNRWFSNDEGNIYKSGEGIAGRMTITEVKE